jgi:hypothetical protein
MAAERIEGDRMITIGKLTQCNSDRVVETSYLGHSQCMYRGIAIAMRLLKKQGHDRPSHSYERACRDVGFSLGFPYWCLYRYMHKWTRIPI